MENNLSNYTDAIGSLGSTASGILGALTGGNSNKPATPTPAATPAKTNWGLIGGIGAAVLLVLVVVLAGRK